MYSSLFFRYSGLVAASRTRLMLFISFLICSIASVFSSITEEASIWNICEYTDTSRTHLDFGDHYSMIMTICNYVVLFLIPFVFISIIYSIIYTEAHANSERIRRDSNCTLLQGSTLVHHMFKCSVKITDRLGKLKFVQKLFSQSIFGCQADLWYQMFVSFQNETGKKVIFKIGFAFPFSIIYIRRSVFYPFCNEWMDNNNFHSFIPTKIFVTH